MIELKILCINEREAVDVQRIVDSLVSGSIRVNNCVKLTLERENVILSPLVGSLTLLVSKGKINDLSLKRDEKLLKPHKRDLNDPRNFPGY